MATVGAISAAPNGLMAEVPWIVDRIGDRIGSRRILYIFIIYHYIYIMYTVPYMTIMMLCGRSNHKPSPIVGSFFGIPLSIHISH